jgi:hypothetical protein
MAAAAAAKGRTEMEVGADGVAVITICNPPVNSLSIDGTRYLLSLVVCLLSFVSGIGEGLRGRVL